MGVGIKGFGGSGSGSTKLQGFTALPPAATAAKGIFGISHVTDSLEIFLDATNTDSYPGSGTTWFDIEAGSDDDFTSNGTVTFNGTPPEHFTYAAAASWKLTAPAWFNALHQATGTATFELWIDSDAANWNSVEATTISYLFNSGNSGGETSSGMWITSAGKLHLFTGKDTAGQFIDDSSLSVPIGMHQIVVAFSTAGGTVTGDYYVDGTFFESITSGSIGAAAGGSSQLLTIATGASSPVTHTFGGKMHMIRMYSKVLDASEILQNFDANKAEFGL